ncbi:MAG: allantoinase PuuE [Chloroflexi bacterium]|nr:allantoinase PuuE [Chloroflexota bacterium]
MERDLVGYGMNPPKVEWPNKARIAVSVVVNYEEGSEYSPLDGDDHHDTNGEVPSPVPPAQRDLGNESMFEYGSRVGVWRIMNMLDKHNVNATFYCCGQALERNPDVGREITRRGHEAMGHGYRWIDYWGMDKESERREIKRAVESIERTTGQRPLGWYTRYGWGPNTRELLVEEGGFEYDCLSYNDDLPYYTEVQGKRWLVLPYSLEVNDTRFWRGGIFSNESYFDCMKDAFDLLYAEGETHPKMLSIGLHCRIVGRPSRAGVLDRFLAYANSKPGVWFARRTDIARWWKEKYA